MEPDGVAWDVRTEPAVPPGQAGPGVRPVRRGSRGSGKVAWFLAACCVAGGGELLAAEGDAAWVREGGDRSRVIGFRGTFGFKDQPPENSLPGIDYAYEQFGLDGVEMDVAQTADKISVVFHDDSLLRTVGIEGSVGEYTFHALQRLSLGTWDRKTVRIPSLEEALRRNGTRGWFFVDVKWDNGVLLPGIREAVQRSGIDRRCLHFTCADPAGAVLYQGTFPGARVSLKLYVRPDQIAMEAIRDAENLGLDGLMFPIYDVYPTRAFVDALHRRGLLATVFVHHGGLADGLQVLVDRRVDYILTNRGEQKAGVVWPEESGPGVPRVQVRIWMKPVGRALGFLGWADAAFRLQESEDLKGWTDIRGMGRQGPDLVNWDTYPYGTHRFYRLERVSRRWNPGE